MPGIVSALISCYDICAFRQKVDNLAFSFITPLGTDNHYVSHYLLLIN
jgi:hypothetical protein